MLLLIVCAAAVQLLIGAGCAVGYRHARRPAGALIGSAACCLLVCVFGERLLRATHTPSSFDPLADGFMLDAVHLSAALGLLILGCGLSLWLAYAIPRRCCD